MGSEDILMPREAGRYISDNSQNVKILAEGVDNVATLVFDLIKNGKADTDIKRWSTHKLNPKTGECGGHTSQPFK